MLPNLSVDNVYQRVDGFRASQEYTGSSPFGTVPFTRAYFNFCLEKSLCLGHTETRHVWRSTVLLQGGI